MRYCKNCGKQLAEGETCTCNKGGIWKKIKDFFVQHFGKTAEQIGFLERSKAQHSYHLLRRYHVQVHRLKR